MTQNINTKEETFEFEVEEKEPELNRLRNEFRHQESFRHSNAIAKNIEDEKRYELEEMREHLLSKDFSEMPENIPKGTLTESNENV